MEDIFAKFEEIDMENIKIADDLYAADRIEASKENDRLIKKATEEVARISEAKARMKSFLVCDDCDMALPDVRADACPYDEIVNEKFTKCKLCDECYDVRIIEAKCVWKEDDLSEWDR